MVITRVNALSVAKVAAILYAGVGLLIGGMFSLIGIAGLSGAFDSVEGGAFLGALFGIGAIIIMPIIYAVFGFIGSFIFASLFNVAAGMTGGIEVDVK
jgi:hypothetical protein